MGGGGKQTSTQSSEPWSAAQPYLKDVYAQAQNLYNSGAPEFWQGTANAPMTPEMQAALGNIWNRSTAGSPLLDTAQATTGAAAGGALVGTNPAYGYLEGIMGAVNPATGMAGDLASSTMAGTNPALQYLTQEASGANVGKNPWISSAFDDAAQKVRDNFTKTTVPALQSDYSMAGRYGSNALATALGQAKGSADDQVRQLATSMYGGAYNTDRQLQAQAQQGLTNAYAQDIASKIGAGNFLSGIYDADLQRKLYGAQQIGQLGQQDISNMLGAAQAAPGMAQADYADLDRQMQVGQYQQDQAQAEQDLQRQRYEYGQQEPYNWLQDYAQLIYGNPGSQSGFGTQTSTQRTSGNTFGQIMGGLMGIGSLASRFMGSDVRMKTDIKRVGTLDNDLPVYSYRYKFGGPPMIGVMAQDVEKVKPHAVATDIWTGLKAVDYSEAVKPA